MILVTSHAAARFQERVRPGLDYEVARKELQRLLQDASLVPTPEWAIAAMPIRRNHVCAELSDGVVVVCELDDDRCKAITVLTRQGHPRRRPEKKGFRGPARMVLGRTSRDELRARRMPEADDAA